MRHQHDYHAQTAIQDDMQPPASFMGSHWPVLLGLCIAIAVAYPEWYLHSYYDVGDLGRLNVPQRIVLGWFYRHHWLPLWNPFSFGGQPFLEAGQAGPLYLPNVLFGLLPISPALKLSNLLHEWFAALTMYGLIWSIARNRFGAFVGGFVYVTSAIWVGHIVHTQMIDALAWLPAIVWATYALLMRPNTLAFLGLSASFAMEVYAGHPQISWFTALTVLVFMVVFLFQRNQPNRLGSVFLSICAVVFALFLSSAQWLPTLELVKHSTRHHVSSAFLLDGYLPKTGLLQFLTPFTPGGGYTNVPYSVKTFTALYGNPYFWELFTYAGVVALSIATATAVHQFRSSYFVQSLTVLAIFSVLFSLAKLPFVEQALLHVPGFDFFRVSARYAGITDFAIAGLAGFGFSRLSASSTSRSLFVDVGLRWYIAAASSIYAIILIFARWHGPLSVSPPSAIWVPVAALCVVAAVCVAPTLHIDRVWTLTTLIVLDGLSATIPFVTLNMTKTAPYLTPSPAMQYVRTHLHGTYPFTRVVAIDNNENDNNSLAQDKSAAYLIPAANGYDSLVPSWYQKAFNLTWTDSTLKPDAQAKLDAMDVAYAVTLSSYYPKYLQTWKHVFSGGGENVYQNPDAVHVWTQVQSGGPSRAVPSSLQSWTANRQIWSLDTAKSGTVVLSQTYDPGWHATVDNKPVTISMTKLGLTGVRLPKGTHRVVLWYRPFGFRVGSILSMLSGIAWSLLLLRKIIRRSD